MKLIAIAGAAILAGCAAPKPTIWNKPGGTLDMLHADVAACSMLQLPQPRATGGVQAVADAMNEEALYLNCMASKGWRQQQ